MVGVFLVALPGTAVDAEKNPGTAMSGELKPCPLCGCDEIKVCVPYNEEWDCRLWIDCPKCGLSVPKRSGNTWSQEAGTVYHIEKTTEELTEYWNRRAAPSLDGLRAMVEKWNSRPVVRHQSEYDQGLERAYEQAADELAAEIERMGSITKEQG